MIRGIYTAASGMIAESLRNDTISNNLANANTAGYKKDMAVTKDFASLLIERVNDGLQTPVIGSMGTGSVVDEVATIQNAGSLRQTGNDLDFSIEGQGFFAVQTPNGVRYTRDGSFSRDSAGRLVTQDGYPVLGQDGAAIRLNGGKVNVAANGQVSVDGVNAGRLQVVQFANARALQKEGNNLYIAGNQQPQAATGTVRQGSLEMSNVNVVSEMVNLIAGYRAYEVNGKMVQAQDSTLDKAVNDVGKV